MGLPILATWRNSGVFTKSQEAILMTEVPTMPRKSALGTSNAVQAKSKPSSAA